MFYLKRCLLSVYSLFWLDCAHIRAAHHINYFMFFFRRTAVSCSTVLRHILQSSVGSCSRLF